MPRYENNRSRIRELSSFLTLFFIMSFLLSILGVVFVLLDTRATNVTELSSRNNNEVTNAALEISTSKDLPPEKNDEQNDSVANSIDSWTPESNPIFDALRNFLFQARDGLFDISSKASESSAEPTEAMMKAIEQGLIEATTLIIKTASDLDFTTPTHNQVEDLNLKSVSIEKESIREREFGSKLLSTSSKRQNVISLMANTTTACSDCYDKLNSCVQKCFADNNCHDVKRRVRSCPATPTRLCNPFSQWSPVDECQSHADCKSPELCCNDGCINKCSPGIWRTS